MKRILIGILVLLSAGFPAYSQITLSIDSAVERMLLNHGEVQSALLRVQAAGALHKTAFELNPTRVSFLYGQYNSYVNNDQNWTIGQEVPLPMEMAAKSSYLKAQKKAEEASGDLLRSRLRMELGNACARYIFLENQLKIYQGQDTLMEKMLFATKKRLEAGAIGILEYQLLRSKVEQIRLERQQLELQFTNLETALKNLLQTDESLHITESTQKLIPGTIMGNAELKHLQESALVLESEIRLERSSLWPNLDLSYFNQTLIGGPTSSEPNAPLAGSNYRFQGFGVGIQIPLFPGATLARAKQAQLLSEAAHFEIKQKKIDLQNQWNLVSQKWSLIQTQLTQYQEEVLPMAGQIRAQSTLAYERGELNYPEFLWQWQEALQIELRFNQLKYEADLTRHQFIYLQGNPS
ncbi:MAG: TolC family protein [Bacteroidota bacterium]|nr:TolC family protein [Bacteroidota bacterium]MDX5431050.1 TolC family protein [Bacteroidota bacterium]MDX5469804.1 TolC family protein [Bacteroidota bacterium]